MLNHCIVNKFVITVTYNSTYNYCLIKYHQSINENQSAIISAAFFNNYLERGQGLSKGTGTELEERDHRKSYFVNAAYQLGNDNSNAILKSLIGYRESTYQNRLEATQGLNHDAIYTQLDFQYNVSGKTYLTSQVTYEELNYDTNTQQDRGVTSVLAGMKWHKEEFTHFDFSLGSYFLDFDSGALQDLNDFRWKTKFRWSPIERIELSLESARSVDENRQVENSYLITDKYEFLFSYKFNEKLELFIQSRFDDSEYYYEDRNQREEAFSNNVSLFYKFRDDMSVSIGYVYKELNAIEEDIDYEKNQLVLGFGFVL